MSKQMPTNSKFEPVKFDEIIRDAMMLATKEMQKQNEAMSLDLEILSCVILDGITDAYEQDKWKLQAMATLKGMNTEHDDRFDEAQMVCDKILKTERGQKFLKELNFTE